MDFDLFQFGNGYPWVAIGLCLACIVLLIQLFYFFFLFIRVSLFKISREKKTTEPVSVVICSKNEFDNLSQNLERVLSQDYPNFQVVVVNDCSWDDTESFLEELSVKHKNLKVVTIKEQEKYRHGKKFALSLGIKAAEHELLLFTDADCYPATDNWITEMVSGYSSDTEIVIGYGAYERGPGLLNYIIRYDTIVNAIHYLSFALSGIPYMGVGRNLSYKKELFFKNKGFASHFHILSGDDDLFINETATSHNSSVVLSPDSYTMSMPKKTWKEWFKQKKRHLTTGVNYKLKHRVLIGGFYFSQFVFYSSLIGLLIMNFNIQLVIALYLIRLCCQMLVFGLGMKKLYALELMFFIPLLDILLMILYGLLSVANLLKKDKNWK